jgi:protein SPT2
MERMKLSAPGPSNRRQTSQLSTSSSDFKHGQPTPPPTDGATTISKPLKKGSFAEIMARGKQNAEKMAQIGKIQHKRIEKPISKRERAELEAAKAAKMSKNIGPGGKFSNTPGAKAINGKMSAVGPSNGKLGKNGKLAPPEPEKKIKKAALATTGYAGTARPKPGSKPGQKPSHASSSRDRYGRKLPPLGSRLDRYDSYDDEDDMLEDDEEEDDQPDYASDVSSDMEAAAFEVDEEEELATKIARKEDAEALAEENRLKREKAEKKKKLMAMAAKAGKRR